MSLAIIPPETSSLISAPLITSILFPKEVGLSYISNDYSSSILSDFSIFLYIDSWDSMTWIGYIFIFLAGLSSKDWLFYLKTSNTLSGIYDILVRPSQIFKVLYSTITILPSALKAIQLSFKLFIVLEGSIFSTSYLWKGIIISSTYFFTFSLFMLSCQVWIFYFYLFFLTKIKFPASYKLVKY